MADISPLRIYAFASAFTQTICILSALPLWKGHTATIQTMIQLSKVIHVVQNTVYCIFA